MTLNDARTAGMIQPVSRSGNHKNAINQRLMRRSLLRPDGLDASA
jgi:hypothetical protein